MQGLFSCIGQHNDIIATTDTPAVQTHTLLLQGYTTQQDSEKEHMMILTVYDIMHSWTVYLASV